MSYEAAAELGERKYPQNGKEIKYGTAGFRTKADDLDCVMYRMGILAVLRSKERNGAAIGAMITASHNPLCDNGIKLVEPLGEMLLPEWEVFATRLANTTNEQLGNVIQQIVDESSIDMNEKALVYVGRDTRPSCERLQEALSSGIEIMSGEMKYFGIISTPVLHFVVTCHNDGGSYGTPSLEGYYGKISQSFVKLRDSGNTRGNYVPLVLFDGANGVGANMMDGFVKYLKESLRVEMYNKGDGELNKGCGADYVKSNQLWPTGVRRSPGFRCASVDGDADRVVYSYIDDKDQFHLLDGDKIATLIAEYIQKLLKKSGLELRLGLVQTAYANGASTAYITEKLGVPVACSKTGVKHLHHVALQFDIGVYFEANGHGTVIFKDSAKKAIIQAAQEGNCDAMELSLIMSVINETVGDAIADLLVVEHILFSNGWSAQDWDKAYDDLPNTLMKVTVPDRAVIQTTNAERTCVSPKGLQEQIDKLVAKYHKSRSFVRPSGTEDVVRVYAEAQSKEDVENLAKEVAQAVKTAVNS